MSWLLWTAPTESQLLPARCSRMLEVLAIAQDMEERVDKEPKVTTTVTLAVSLAEAQKITLAEETGVLRLA